MHEEMKLTRREKVMLTMLCISVFLAILSVGLFYTNRKSVKKEYLAFEEKYNASYIVELKDNEHFGDAMNPGGVYISKLADNVRTNLSYRLEYGDVEVTTSYTYKVYVLTELSVKDHTKPVYSKKDMIVNVSTPVEGKSVIIFNEVVNVDYDTCLKESKDFASEYGLTNVTTKVTVVMEVQTIATNKKFVKDSILNTNVKVNIPVTDSTFTVDVAENSTRNQKVLLKSSESSHLGTISFVYALFAVGVFVLRIVYKRKTRDGKEIYEDRLEDILSNYESYIQKVHGEVSLDGYDLVEVSDIEDLLEIKETVNMPILMIEGENSTEFVILNKNNLSYVYRLEESVE